MAKRLDENLGSMEYDNLINSTYPAAEVYTVKVVASQGVIKRGTVLAKDSGGMKVLDTPVTGKANAILAEDVDTGSGEAVNAIAYRTGHFNRNQLIVGADYQITEADEEALRVAGILLSDAM